MKRFFALVCLVLIVFSLAVVAFAHPGGTDGNGGHYVGNSGKYHYHHGYPAHQHEDGECPYDFDDNTNDVITKEYFEPTYATKQETEQETEEETQSNITKESSFFNKIKHIWQKINIGLFSLFLSCCGSIFLLQFLIPLIIFLYEKIFRKTASKQITDKLGCSLTPIFTILLWILLIVADNDFLS